MFCTGLFTEGFYPPGSFWIYVDFLLQKTTHDILSSKKKQQISSRAPKPQHFQVILVFLGFLGFKFRAWGLGFEFWAWGLGLWVLSLRLRCSIWIFYDPVRFLRFLGFEFRAWGLGFGFWAWGLGFWAWGLRLWIPHPSPKKTLDFSTNLSREQNRRPLLEVFLLLMNMKKIPFSPKKQQNS